MGNDICCLHRLRSTALKPWVHCCAPEGEMKEVFTADPKLPCWVLAINVLNDLGWSQQGHRALQIPLCYGCSLPISEIKGWTSGSLFNIGFFLRQIFFFNKNQIQNRTWAPQLSPLHPQQWLSCCSFSTVWGDSGWPLQLDAEVKSGAAVSTRTRVPRPCQENSGVNLHRGNGICVFWSLSLLGI